MVEFPELHRESTLELPVVAALSAIAGGLLLPVSLVVGAVAFLPCGLWLLHAAWLGILNRRLRDRWSRRFSRRLNGRQLRAVLEREPKRFIVHIRYFGGFDVIPLRPAVVVEDRATGEVAAIYPASWHVPRVCEQLGVEVIQE
jgi:hypothetical protein